MKNLTTEQQIDKELHDTARELVSTMHNHFFDLFIADLAHRLSPPLTYKQIGDAYGVTRQRIHNIERKHKGVIHEK